MTARLALAVLAVLALFGGALTASLTAPPSPPAERPVVIRTYVPATPIATVYPAPH